MQKILAYLDHGKEAYTNIDGLMGDVKLNSHTQDPGPKTAGKEVEGPHAMETLILTPSRYPELRRRSIGHVRPYCRCV